MMVVEALGSDLIQNLREVTSHLRASVSPSINEDSSSVPSQMAEGDSSSSTVSAWDTVHTLQLCVNIITRKMLRTVGIIIAVILWERDGQPLKGCHSSHYGQKELPGSRVDNGPRGK